MEEPHNGKDMPPIAPPESVTRLIQPAGGKLSGDTISILGGLGEYWSGADFIDADGLLRQVNDLGWDASTAAERSMRNAESEWRAKGRDR